MKIRVWLFLWKLIGDFTISQWQKEDGGEWANFSLVKDRFGYRFYINGKGCDKSWQGAHLMREPKAADAGVEVTK